MNLGNQPGVGDLLLVFLASIGGIGPDRRGGVGLVQQATQLPSVVTGGVGHPPCANESISPIRADMALVAIRGRGDLHHERPVWALFAAAALQDPAPIPVFLAQFGGLRRPFLGDVAFLERLFLLISVTLAWGLDDRSVDHLASHGEVALLFQTGIEPGEQRLHCIRLCQCLPEQPDRAGIRNATMQVKPEKAHEAEPISDLELGLFVSQSVEALQHKHLKHHYRIHRWSTALCAVGAIEGANKLRPKNLKINHCNESI